MRQVFYYIMVLDLGCGTGEYTRVTRERIWPVIFGIDKSAVMIRHAKAKGGEYVLGDALAVPLRDKSVSYGCVSRITRVCRRAIRREEKYGRVLQTSWNMADTHAK